MSDNIKPLKTVKNSSEAEIKEKGSIFKAVIFPVNDQESVSFILNRIRKEYYDATHHCYACRLKDGSFKYSDDGEPSGTAGKRILNAIDHHNLKDVLCIVIRWFGGTKLGTGPLGKAYHSSAEECINISEIVILHPFKHYKIKAAYEFTRQLYHIFDKYKIRIESTDYTDIPEYKVLLPFINYNSVLQEFEILPGNKVEVTDLSDISYIMDTALD